MKALLCRELGSLDALAVDEVAPPNPGARQVSIAVKAAGVNFPDILMVQGKYQFKPPLPFSPGCELAGIVKTVGEGVTHVKPGDAVLAIVMHGAFAEEALAEADRVVPLPPGVDFEVAASFMFTYGTSYHALKDRAQLAQGETLLVLGAAGGVGIAAVELGKTFAHARNEFNLARDIQQRGVIGQPLNQVGNQFLIAHSLKLARYADKCKVAARL